MEEQAQRVSECANQETILINPRKVRMQALYQSTRKCNAMNKAGKKCMAIAMEGSDYCRNHSQLPPLMKLKEQYDKPGPMYGQIDMRDFRKDYEHFLQHKTIAGVRDEIALCRAYLSQMLKYPDYVNKDRTQISLESIAAQIEVIKTIRGLSLAAKKMEIQDKYFGKANESIKAIVTQAVLIIDRFVTDDKLKAVLANEFFKLGKKEDQPAGVVDMGQIETEKFLSADKEGKKSQLEGVSVATEDPNQLKKESKHEFDVKAEFSTFRPAAELCNA